MRQGLPDELVNDRTQPVPAGLVLQVLYPKPAGLQPLKRQVAAAPCKVSVDIAQNIGKLEPLAEAHSELPHLSRRPASESGNMSHRQISPELADTAGHVVAIEFQLTVVFQRANLAALTGGKARQVGLHSPRQGGNEPANEAAITVAEFFQDRKALSDPAQKLLLGKVLPGVTHPGDHRFQALRVGPGELELATKTLELEQPLIYR